MRFAEAHLHDVECHRLFDYAKALRRDDERWWCFYFIYKVNKNGLNEAACNSREVRNG